MARGRILVIDDSLALLELFRQILEAEGYEVQLSSVLMGDIGAIERLQPDLVIIDCMMPLGKRLTGWQLLRQASLHPATASLPFLVCTAWNPVLRDPDGYCSRPGIVVVAKPFDVDDLLSAIQQILSSQSVSDP